jgi:predicted ATPase
MTPIVVSLDFYSSVFYRKDEENKTLGVSQHRDRKEVKNYLQKNAKDSKATELRIERLLESKRTNFVVEEPELNLFPTTQRNLLNFLVACCNKRRKHSLTITTHSPYIINQLNLLLKAYDKDKKIDNASINFDELNVYIVQNGTIQDLKIKNEGVHIINTENLSDDINDIYDIYEKL